jgi:hypothetical protein
MKPNEIVRKKRAAAIRRHENHHGFCSQTHPCNSSTSNANPHSRQIAQHGSSRNHYIANYAHNCSQSNPIKRSNFPNNSFNTDHHQHHKNWKSLQQQQSLPPIQPTKTHQIFDETQPRKRNSHVVTIHPPIIHSDVAGPDGDRSTKNWPPKILVSESKELLATTTWYRYILPQRLWKLLGGEESCGGLRKLKLMTCHSDAEVKV